MITHSYSLYFLLFRSSPFHMILELTWYLLLICVIEWSSLETSLTWMNVSPYYSEARSVMAETQLKLRVGNFRLNSLNGTGFWPSITIYQEPTNGEDYKACKIFNLLFLWLESPHHHHSNKITNLIPTKLRCRLRRMVIWVSLSTGEVLSDTDRGGTVNRNVGGGQPTKLSTAPAWASSKAMSKPGLLNSIQNT